jgi:hypothetical protein
VQPSVARFPQKQLADTEAAEAGAEVVLAVDPTEAISDSMAGASTATSATTMGSAAGLEVQVSGTMAAISVKAPICHTVMAVA